MSAAAPPVGLSEASWEQFVCSCVTDGELRCYGRHRVSETLQSSNQQISESVGFQFFIFQSIRRCGVTELVTSIQANK